jgi:hypothetical protein
MAAHRSESVHSFALFPAAGADSSTCKKRLSISRRITARFRPKFTGSPPADTTFAPLAFRAFTTASKSPTRSRSTPDPGS